MDNLRYQDYLDGTAKVLADSQSETEPYETTVLSEQFIVYPGVFSPKYFEDTEFFAREVPKLVNPAEDFLEIGPGTGIVLIFTALAVVGKRMGIDINHRACANTRANVRKHGLQQKITIKRGDLYQPLAAEEKFDVIFWNTPFGLVESDHLTDLEKSVFDPGYLATKRFVGQASDHLKPGGRLLIGFSTTLGRFDLLKEFLDEAGFEVKLIAKTESIETHPVSFELFVAKIDKMEEER